MDKRTCSASRNFQVNLSCLLKTSPSMRSCLPSKRLWGLVTGPANEMPGELGANHPNTCSPRQQLAPGRSCSDVFNGEGQFLERIFPLCYLILMACVKIQIHKNQTSYAFISELAKTMVLLWFCLAACRDTERVSVAPGWRVLAISLLVYGTTATPKILKPSLFFLNHLLRYD